VLGISLQQPLAFQIPGQTVLDGVSELCRNCNVMPGVEEALGRPATDFKTYVQKTIESGVLDTVMQKESA